MDRFLTELLIGIRLVCFIHTFTNGVNGSRQNFCFSPGFAYRKREWT